MNKPLASWVCVTHDRIHLLNELLYCFLSQDYDNRELIILNDQIDVVLKYNDPRIKIYNKAVRFSTLGLKRNFSRTLTNGDYIFISDDDDIYYSNHTSKLLEFHENHPEYDIIGNKYYDYSEELIDIYTWEVSVLFNGSCIKKEYWQNNEFPVENNFREDVDFIKDAKTFKIDGNTTFHYRKNIGVPNISEMNVDELKFLSEIKEYNETTSIENIKTIELCPELSEKTKSYYR